MTQLRMAGKPVAESIRNTLKEKFAKHRVMLATFIIGNNPAAHVYKRSLLKTAASLGIATRDIELPEDVTQQQAERAMEELSLDNTVTGILPLMPVPSHLDRTALIYKLDPDKDMDCIHPLNSGRFYVGASPWGPCTPRACMAILKYYQIPLAGEDAVMVGYGDVVGRPLTLMLIEERCTVTVCRSTTKDLPAKTSQADLVVSAVGCPNLITEPMIRPDAVIVDVGINSVDGKLVGDISEAAKLARASAYTPVPGGVGMVSNLMVMQTLTRKL